MGSRPRCRAEHCVSQPYFECVGLGTPRDRLRSPRGRFERRYWIHLRNL